MQFACFSVGLSGILSSWNVHGLIRSMQREWFLSKMVQLSSLHTSIHYVVPRPPSSLLISIVTSQTQVLDLQTYANLPNNFRKPPFPTSENHVKYKNFLPTNKKDSSPHEFSHIFSRRIIRFLSVSERKRASYII